jgi:hypothetical protein
VLDLIALEVEPREGRRGGHGSPLFEIVAHDGQLNRWRRAAGSAGSSRATATTYAAVLTTPNAQTHRNPNKQRIINSPPATAPT